MDELELDEKALPAAEYEEEEEDDGRSDLSEDEILRIFSDLRAESDDDELYRDLGKMIETICTNRPLTSLITFANFTRRYTEPTVTLQILYNLILTWASIIVKARPSIYAVAQTDELESTVAAKIATKFIEYFETEESVADKWHQTALYAAQHGTGLMHICYDPASKRVRWEPLSIFDVYLENRANHEDIDWAIVKSYIKPHEAKTMLRKVDDYAGTPAVEEYCDAMGVPRTGVEKFSCYIRPCERDGLKDGLYFCVVGGRVVEALKYQNVFPEIDGNGKKAILPIVFWSARSVRGSTLGTTWATDVSDSQVSINAIMSKMNRDALNSRQLQILPAILRDTDMLDETNARLFVDPANESAVGVIRWDSPAPIDQGVQMTLDKDIEAMYIASGISQSTSGDASASQSGKALAFQAELDANKHSDAFKSFEVAQRQAWELTLKLVQKYYTSPRQLKIAGSNPLAFSAADIAGVSVKLEHRTEKESARSTKLENAKEDMANGFAGREALLDASPSPLTSGMRLQAEEIVENFLAGMDVDITAETLPSEIVIGVVDEMSQQSMLERDLEAVRALSQFKKDYLKMLASVQEPDAPATVGGAEDIAPLPEQVSDQPMPKVGE